MNNDSEIFKEYLKDERCIEESLKRKLLALTKDDIGIGSDTGKILLFNQKLSNNDKVLFYLIGVYISHELGLRDKNKADLSELSKELGIIQTTLSAPVKTLLDKGIIRRDESVKPSEYFVTSIEIRKFIEEKEKEIKKVVTA